MVPDVATGDPTAKLCLNCARRVVSPRVTHKYEGLTRYLKFRAAFTSIIKLSFARIDGLIGSNLPMQAYREEGWWGNLANAHSRGWLDAGWDVQEVNLKEGTVVLKKVRDLPRVRGRKKNPLEITQPFTPVPVHPTKRKEPSKTKVSKLYARILNMERNRSMGYSYTKGFRPRSQYEKRLFDPDKKPR